MYFDKFTSNSSITVDVITINFVKDSDSIIKEVELSKEVLIHIIQLHKASDLLCIYIELIVIEGSSEITINGCFSTVIDVSHIHFFWKSKIKGICYVITGVYHTVEVLRKLIHFNCYLVSSCIIFTFGVQSAMLIII